MGYDVATTGLLEEALSEGFQYHNELDIFVLRAGVARSDLNIARDRALARAEQSTRSFGKAPKRFVAQELLALLSERGKPAEAVLAAIVDGFRKGSFRNASAGGLEAIEALKQKLSHDRQEREAERQQQAEEERRHEDQARRQREAASALRERQREALRDRFINLAAESDVQRRGYQLEPFMNDLFELEGLDPRGSFRLVGEQIDGSMMLRGRSNLVEVKWVKSPVAGKEFGAFTFKIEGKSADTRGLFVSINGYSREAIQALNRKGSLKFVCIDGTHIMRSLTPGQSLLVILDNVWRHADETGEAYLPASKLE